MKIPSERCWRLWRRLNEGPAVPWQPLVNQFLLSRWPLSWPCWLRYAVAFLLMLLHIAVRSVTWWIAVDPPRGTRRTSK